MYPPVFVMVGAPVVVAVETVSECLIITTPLPPSPEPLPDPALPPPPFPEFAVPFIKLVELYGPPLPLVIEDPVIDDARPAPPDAVPDDPLAPTPPTPPPPAPPVAASPQSPPSNPCLKVPAPPSFIPPPAPEPPPHPPDDPAVAPALPPLPPPIDVIDENTLSFPFDRFPPPPTVTVYDNPLVAVNGDSVDEFDPDVSDDVEFLYPPAPPPPAPYPDGTPPAPPPATTKYSTLIGPPDRAKNPTGNTGQAIAKIKCNSAMQHQTLMSHSRQM